MKWYINFLRHPKYVLRTEKQNTQSIFSSDRLQIVRQILSCHKLLEDMDKRTPTADEIGEDAVDGPI